MKRLSVTLVGCASGLLIAGCSAAMPANLGVRDGRLAPCPASPNCVSSQSADEEHRMAALDLKGTPAEVMARLKSIIGKMPRARIVSETETYLHVEFRSAMFRFVDDVEFFIDQKESVIHLRSAARTGHSDFGVNRNRMEQISAAWRTRPQ